MIFANDPNRKSWVEVPNDSDFPIQNIPFGIISYKDYFPRPATRIGDYAIDLSSLSDLGYFDELDLDDLSPFYQPVLNPFIELPADNRRKVRNRIAELFDSNNPELRDQEEHKEEILIPIEQCCNFMPVLVPDYTDFYSSYEHASNVGVMFRGPVNPLMPNWKHIPIGYHGRSSSIVISETEIHRPKGQILPPEKETPIFSPSKRLDFELEMAFITSSYTNLGESIPIEDAHKHIFGLVLFNDLSARDIQKWEYQPLGPFLSKSFGSVISPWIVTLDALEPFRTDQPKQEPEVLPYLKAIPKSNFDIDLEVHLQPMDEPASKICHTNFKYMYWSMYQQLAHQTVAGCNISVGDIYASGTISGPTPDSYGSMLELSWAGKNKIQLKNGKERTFIEDNDTIIMKGYAQKDGVRIGFGESKVKILPAK